MSSLLGGSKEPSKGHFILLMVFEPFKLGDTSSSLWLSSKMAINNNIERTPAATLVPKVELNALEVEAEFVSLVFFTTVTITLKDG